MQELILENKTQTPVLGHGSNEIIGHWDNSTNKFIPINDSIMKQTMNKFMAGNSIYPLAIRIMDNEVDGSYLTYRAIGSKVEDPRVIIYVYENDNKELTVVM